MTQTLKSNEGYAQISEIYNQKKNVHQIISDTLIQVSLAMQVCIKINTTYKYIFTWNIIDGTVRINIC